MFDPHQLIARHGLAGARLHASNKNERVCVEAAAEMAAREGEKPEVVCGGLAVACLPRRRPTDGPEAATWTRDLYAARYRVEADLGGGGVPFGSKARMIMLWLHDQAIKKKSPVIDVVPSMHAWMRQLGIEIGGMTYRIVGEQMERIATCRIEIARNDDEFTGDAVPVVDRLVFGDDEIGPRSDEFHKLNKLRISDHVVLGRGFFDQIMADPVPLDPRALQLISNNCWAMDLYVALAYQLPRLTESSFMNWHEFDAYFGATNKYAYHMKASFLAAVPLVQAIYKNARIEIGAQGITYFPSPSPI